MNKVSKCLYCGGTIFSVFDTHNAEDYIHPVNPERRCCSICNGFVQMNRLWAQMIDSPDKVDENIDRLKSYICQLEDEKELIRSRYCEVKASKLNSNKIKSPVQKTAIVVAEESDIEKKKEKNKNDEE